MVIPLVLFILIQHCSAGYLDLLLNDTDLKGWNHKDLLKNLEKELELEKIETVSVQIYPVVIPQNLVIQLCFKDTPLLEKLDVNTDECGGDYECMFSKLVNGESMELILKLVIDESDVNTNSGLKDGIRDCAEWWRLFKEFNKEKDASQELAKCIMQSFASRCEFKVLDVVKGLLVSPEETT